MAFDNLTPVLVIVIVDKDISYFDFMIFLNNIETTVIMLLEYLEVASALNVYQNHLFCLTNYTYFLNYSSYQHSNLVLSFAMKQVADIQNTDYCLLMTVEAIDYTIVITNLNKNLKVTQIANTINIMVVYLKLDLMFIVN